MKHLTAVFMATLLLAGCTNKAVQNPSKTQDELYREPPSAYIYLTCKSERCWNWETGEFIGRYEGAKDGQYIVWSLEDPLPISNN